MSECRTIRELCSIVVDCPHSTPTWTSEGKIVVRNNNIKNGRIDLSSPSYTDEEHFSQRVRRAVPQPGDLIITREAPIGDVGMIPEGVECCLGQRMVLLRADPSICDSYYLLYSLQSRWVQHQISWSEGTGTTVSNLRIPHLEQIKIPYLPLPKQKAIASVLRSLEEKMCNNRKINDNLLQQAETLFHSWFVNFEPFGRVMPSNWHFSTLGESTDMGAGGDKPNVTSSVKTVECPYPIYSNGLSDEGLYGYTDNPKISDESVTVSARGTIGYVCLRHIPYVPIVRLITLVPKNELISAKYLYLYLNQLHISGTGTTQQQLTVPDFRKTEILIPSKEVMARFTATITPLFDTIWSNQELNGKIASLRDTLLPKLMSGEIDVSAVQL